MARTHSRQISRKKAKKKNPFPAVLLLLYILGLSLTYVYFYIDTSNKESMLKGKQDLLAEKILQKRNLETDVERYTGKTFIMKKVKEMGLGLGYHITGQVVEVRHLEDNNSLKPQQLRENDGEDAFAFVER